MPSVSSSQPNPYLAVDGLSVSQAQPETSNIKAPQLSPMTTVATPETQNQTQSYASTEMSPSSLAFEESINPADLLSKARLDAESLSPRQQTQLDQLATGLGFPNGQTLTHALRHLSAESVQQWQQSLPTQMPSPQQCSEALNSAEQSLSALANSEIETLFSDLDLPAPVFIVEGASRWSAPAYLAVLNNFKTMQAKLPPAVLQEVGAGENNRPLEFVRRDHPRGLSNPGSFLEVLSNSMKIAHTDANHKIYLYDAAVSMDPQDILNSPDLQDYVAKINQRPPSEDHVRSLQDMLNASLPASKQIEANGQMDARTWAALSDFETQQFLKSAEDILRDDTLLPTADRHRLQTDIDNLRRQIAIPNPDDDMASVQLRDQLMENLAAIKTMSPAGRRRVEALTQQHNLGTCANYLKQEHVEMLLSNWLGIIDGGNQLDFTEQVINHELGHIFQERWLADWEKISFQNFEQTPEESKQFMAATLQSHVHDHSHAHESQSGFGSDYARVNAEEDFAESFRLFTRHPEQLLEQNLLKFMYMAGATGAYANREDELVTLAKSQGYSESEIQTATRTLRGQTQEHYVQAVDQLVEKGLSWFNDTWMANSLSRFGYEQGQDVRQSVVGATAASVVQANAPQFNMSSATLLPGLEGALNMSETASRAVHPSQDGYIMSWLEDRAAKLYETNATPAEREAAQQVLNDFWEQGAEVLPEASRQFLNTKQQRQAASPETRAMMLTLAHLESMGQVMRGQNQASQGTQTTFNELRAVLAEISDPETMVEALRETIGTDAFEQLPPPFLNLIRDPETLLQITGRMGRTQLGSDVVLRSVEQAVTQRESMFRSAMGELSSLSSNLMFSLSNLAFTENAAGQTIVNTDEKETMLSMMSQVFRGLAAGRPEFQRNPSASELEQILETMAQNIQSNKTNPVGPESLSLDQKGPQMLETIQGTLLQNLLDLNQLEEGSNDLMPMLDRIRSTS